MNTIGQEVRYWLTDIVLSISGFCLVEARSFTAMHDKRAYILDAVTPCPFQIVVPSIHRCIIRILTSLQVLSLTPFLSGRGFSVHFDEAQINSTCRVQDEGLREG